jgi:hypothetical protein
MEKHIAITFSDFINENIKDNSTDYTKTIHKSIKNLPINQRIILLDKIINHEFEYYDNTEAIMDAQIIKNELLQFLAIKNKMDNTSNVDEKQISLYKYYINKYDIDVNDI